MSVEPPGYGVLFGDRPEVNISKVEMKRHVYLLAYQYIELKEWCDLRSKRLWKHNIFGYCSVFI